MTLYLAGAIILGVCLILMPEYSRFRGFKGAIIGWLGTSALADILITITLTWSLVSLAHALVSYSLKLITNVLQTRLKTGIKETDDKVAKIIRRK